MKNLITILCLCLFSVSFGQEIEWVKTYNISPIDDYGYTEDSAEEILVYASNNLWRDS